MTHPTVKLVTCCGDRAPIDVEMVPVITALWRQKVHTNWCCQGGDDVPASIGFPDVEEADKFCRLVMDGGAAPNLVAGAASPEGRPGEHEMWQWRWHMRFPIATRAGLTVVIPRSQLADLEHWLSDEGRAEHESWVAELGRIAAEMT